MVEQSSYYALINDSRLNRLEQTISRFNPFKIIGVEHREIKHSNVLGWLFDPKGHHGFGDKFVKDFLFDVLEHNLDCETNNPSMGRVLGKNFLDVMVYREYKDIDLLLVSEEQQMVIAIENKIYAGESDGQLNKYKSIVENEFSEYQQLFVYLTIHGNESRHATNWNTYSHEKILPLVQKNLEAVKERINSQVADFVNDYIDLLEDITMGSIETDQLALAIYQQHKAAIDRIIQVVNTDFDISKLEDFHSRTNTFNHWSGKNECIFKPRYSESTGKGSPFDTNDDIRSLGMRLSFRQLFSKGEIWLSLRYRIAANVDDSDFAAQLEKTGLIKFDKKVKSNSNQRQWLDHWIKIEVNPQEIFDYQAITEQLVSVYQGAEVQKIISTVSELLA